MTKTAVTPLDISPYLKLMIEKNASDIFFTVGAEVRLKIQGKLIGVGKLQMTPEMTHAIAYGLMNSVQRMLFEKHFELDFAIDMPENNARFRANVFKQQGYIALVLRYVKTRPPTIEEFKLPSILKDLIMRKRGLILMVGATNSGKSTTLAAMINHRNESQAGHIITIEDPIEFIHPHKKSIVNQRELGVDTHSYAKALRSCMRESPDAILVGEIRDQETMSAALELCNTGHIALSTLHANNAHQALKRIVNMFSHERHHELFMDLSTNLIAIISQRLIPAVSEGRIAAVEIMINSPFIADLILQGKIDEIKETMDGSAVDGMQTFDKALTDLYRNGDITMEEALKNADSRTNLEAKLTFG